MPTLVAAVVMLFGIGAESIWLDEAVTVQIARMDLADFWPLITDGEINGSIYYLFMRVWAVGGTSEAWLRVPSALFAIASVPVVHALGRRLLGPGAVAAVAATLLALNPFLVAYAQEARGYSLAVLLSAAATLLLLRAIDRPTPVRWAAYAVVAGAGLYAHVFAAFVVAAHVVAMLARPVPPVHRRDALVALTAVGLMASPIALAALRPGGALLTWLESPGLREIGRAALLLAGGHVALLVAYAGLTLVATIVAARAWRSGGRDRWPVTLLLVWVTLAPVLSAAVSLVKPLFYPRFLIVILPAMALVAALALARLPSRRAAAAVLAVLLLVSGWQITREATTPAKDDWRAATAYVLDRAADGDAAIFLNASAAKPFAYYVGRQGRADAAPRAIYPQVDWQAPYPVRLRQPTLAAALADVGRDGRVWLIVGVEEDRQALVQPVLAKLAETYEEREHVRFEGIDVRVFDRGVAG